MQTYTGRMPCEQKGREWGRASPSQGTPTLAGNPPEAGGKHGTVRLLLTALRRTNPADTLISEQ